jgi:hypothetical protein
VVALAKLSFIGDLEEESIMKLHRCMVAGVLVLVGCITGTQPDENEGILVGSTGLAIGVAVNSGDGTDVSSIEYKIDRVACYDGEKFEPLSLTVNERLAPSTLPPEFEGSPLDRNSNHPFADHFEVVPAGCYDVKATPLNSQGTVSEECAGAMAQDIEVVDGETTEIFMISQCKGAEAGAMDSVVAFNHPPVLVNLSYSPGKFTAKGTLTTVCATAVDPNSDPIDFEWSLEDGGMCSGPTVASSTIDGDKVTECVSITPSASGSYWFEVRMYDLVTGEDGRQIRIEDWLREHGYPNESHDSLRFPLYVRDTTTSN